MGFGTLFIGYFFVLNFPYCEFTDAIAAFFMLYALYKLSGINEWFRLSAFASIAFAALGVFELAVELYGFFFPLDPTSFLFTITTLVRHLIVAAVTVFMMFGIRDVAKEVGIPTLAEKGNRAGFVAIVVYALTIMLESTALTSFLPDKFLALSYVFITLATLTLIAFNLTCIYSAYMRICMPEDEDMEEKKSKFGFVNAFRKHEEEKSREYAEYKLEKIRKKQEKKNNGRKK